MKLAIKMQDSERKGIIKAVKKFIDFMHDSDNNDDEIFTQAHHIYHEDVSDEEIRKLISEAK